ncbi:GH15876 [Drosophila grimshawi]|uniref:GH15876 n=1 Tax=Drosophila grimshawi TaxID=7222 RepID=B4J0E5_DROGR|nr:GH15876 [Drosophila grimshawi]
MNNWCSMDSMDNWSMVEDRSSMDSNGRCGMNGCLQNGSDDMLDDWFTVHLGDALVGDSRGYTVDNGAHLSQNRFMDHRMGLNQTSAGGGNEQSNNSDL